MRLLRRYAPRNDMHTHTVIARSVATKQSPPNPQVFPEVSIAFGGMYTIEGDWIWESEGRKYTEEIKVELSKDGSIWSFHF